MQAGRLVPSSSSLSVLVTVLSRMATVFLRYLGTPRRDGDVEGIHVLVASRVLQGNCRVCPGVAFETLARGRLLLGPHQSPAGGQTPSP